MHRAGISSRPTLAYETWGEAQRQATRQCHPDFQRLSPSAHASSSAEDLSDGWWEDMIGPGLPLDSNQFHIICVNSLGSCFGSTGPASRSIRPTGELYRLDFPVLTLEDVAEAAYRVVLECARHRATAHRDWLLDGWHERSGLLCAIIPKRRAISFQFLHAARAEPFSIAVRSLQREIIRSDQKWQNGQYDVDDPPIIGQRLARKLGMMSYRSPEEWVQRFGRQRTTAVEENVNDRFKPRFSVEAYLENHANKFSGGFDPNCYLYLSLASDLFDLAEHGGSLRSGFRRTTLQRSLVIGVTTDILFPIHQQRELAEGLAAVCVWILAWWSWTASAAMIPSSWTWTRSVPLSASFSRATATSRRAAKQDRRPCR